MYGRVFLTFLTLQSLLACSNWKNKADRIAVECGIPRSSIGDHRYVKIHSADGSKLQDADQRALKTYFQDSGSDQGHTIPTTPYGCLALPNEQGLLHVLDTRNGESITLKYDGSFSNSEIANIQLQPKPDIQINLACSDEGIFASSVLEQPLYISTTGNASGLDFRLDLFGSDNSYIRTLFHKPKGQAELSLPKHIDISNIQEGSYFLKVYGHHISQGIDSRPQLLSSENLCKLNILRGTVYIGGFEPETKQLVFPPRSPLPWTIQNPFEKLYACQEKRILTGPETLNPSLGCKPQGTCIDLAQYKESIQINTNGPGVFDYFVFAENRAGKKSDLKCQTLIVSDAAPTLSVNWTHEDLKKPGSILRKPYAILKANIDVDHNLLNKDQLNESLSCRVEFEIKGKHTFADQNVICTEGRCKGQSLSKFTPCDRNIGFTMVDSLDQSLLLSSRLILKVRADDGAGHVANAETSLWINQSAWYRESLEFKVENTVMRLYSYIIDDAGDILASFGYPGSGESQYVAVYRNNSWTVISEDKGCECDYKITKGRDGTILVARIGRSRSDVYRYQNSVLELLTKADSQNTVNQCLNFLAVSAEDAYCAGKFNNIFHFSKGVWAQVPSPVDNGSDLSSADWRVLSSGTLVGWVNASLYMWENNKWRITTLKLPSPDPYVQIIEDFKSRVWLYILSNSGRFAPSLQLLDDNELIAFPSSIPFDPTQPTPEPQSSSDAGLAFITFGLQKFDFGTDTWSVLDYPLSAETRTAFFNPANKRFIATANKGFFEDGPDLLYWPLKSLGYPCTNMCSGMERYQQQLYFKDSSKEAHTLVRLRNLPVTSFNSQMLAIRDSYSPGNWMNPHGELSFAFADGVELTFHKENISFDKLPLSDQTTSAVQLSPNSYCIQQWSGLFLYQKREQTFSSKLHDGMGQGNYCSQDNKGTLWWVDSANHLIYRYDGQTAQVVNGFGKAFGEDLNRIFDLQEFSKMAVVTSTRLVLLNYDASISESYPLPDITSGQAAIKVIKADRISSSEIFIELQMTATDKGYYILDMKSGRIVQDKEVKNLIGKHLLQQIKFLGTEGFLLTKNPGATVLQRSGRVWKILATFDDMRPFLIRNVNPPYQLAVDPHGRLWMHTSAPNNLLRLDLQ